MTDESFTITELTGDRRRRLALTVIEKKLEMAVHFGQTDRYALDAARKWANTHFRTTKQALEWVSLELEMYVRADDARTVAQGYYEFIARLNEDQQQEVLFNLLTWAALHGWTLHVGADPAAPSQG